MVENHRNLLVRALSFLGGLFLFTFLFFFNIIWWMGKKSTCRVSIEPDAPVPTAAHDAADPTWSREMRCGGDSHAEIALVPG